MVLANLDGGMTAAATVQRHAFTPIDDLVKLKSRGLDKKPLQSDQ